MRKLQIDNENIHHQFRTSHFMIDKKLNSITNQYANMLEDLKYVKKIWNQSIAGGGSIYSNRGYGFNNNTYASNNNYYENYDNDYYN